MNGARPVGRSHDIGFGAHGKMRLDGCLLTSQDKRSDRMNVELRECQR